MISLDFTLEKSKLNFFNVQHNLKLKAGAVI